MIHRELENVLRQKLDFKKVIIVYGARQVGKSSLLQMIFGGNPNTLWLNGEDSETRNLMENLSSQNLSLSFSAYKTLIIDEAQNVLNIGRCLKMIHDNMPDLQIIATGSSSFDLANKVNEPLTGRKLEYRLFPLSFAEMVAHHGLFEEKRLLNQRLIYGYYPDVVCNSENSRELLNNLASSYLYKDVLIWENLKKSDKIHKLLQAIALQVGAMVSYTELGNLCGLDNKTVEKYIALLEQAFIIFRLPSFSKNLRNELKFSKKIYFYDNGIRNAVIGNFSDVGLRNDVGALWENFAIAERIKRSNYQQNFSNHWFWRTKLQSEIDLIEETDGRLKSFEFKWNPKRKAVVPISFTQAYPETEFCVVSPENIEEFLL